MTMRNQNPAASGGNAGQWLVRIEHAVLPGVALLPPEAAAFTNGI